MKEALADRSLLHTKDKHKVANLMKEALADRSLLHTKDEHKVANLMKEALADRSLLHTKDEHKVANLMKEDLADRSSQWNVFLGRTSTIAVRETYDRLENERSDAILDFHDFSRHWYDWKSCNSWLPCFYRYWYDWKCCKEIKVRR